MIKSKICWKHNGHICHAIARLRSCRFEYGAVQYVAIDIIPPLLRILGEAREKSHANWCIKGNHLGYGQAQGTRATAAEISDLYQGLKNSYLDDFNMMLSGYLPGAASVEAVGTIARDLKLKTTMKPGSFFWVLDPVMGDNGKLYVAEDVVPAYKALIKDADLILPNQFEAE